MTNISRARIRDVAARLRGVARAKVDAATGTVALQRRIQQMERHIKYLERRLHTSEYTLSRLADAGLAVDASTNPESYARWLTWRPPGHFYSPIPNLRELEEQADALWPAQRPAELPGIDLRPDGQLAVFTQIAKLARAFEVHEHKTEPWRYYSDNVAYGVGDALTLHGILRHIRPERLIEIGSGHSSAMTLDTVEHYLGGRTELTFIEPYPELLESLMRTGDRERVTIIPTSLQQVPHEVFSVLQAGDVLFIDSTHVLKTGSDVAWLYGDLLPALNEGVYVHIHDMFYPFEYPREWVLEGRA